MIVLWITVCCACDMLRYAMIYGLNRLSIQCHFFPPVLLCNLNLNRAYQYTHTALSIYSTIVNRWLNVIFVWIYCTLVNEYDDIPNDVSIYFNTCCVYSYWYACTQTLLSAVCMFVTLLSAQTFSDLFDLFNLELEKNGGTKTVWFTACYYRGHSTVLECVWCTTKNTHTLTVIWLHSYKFRSVQFENMCFICMCAFFHSFSDHEVENIKITKMKYNKNSSTISLECIIPNIEGTSMRWTAKVQ